MNLKLQEKLFEKYPKIFIEKDFPIEQSRMAWGIGCADGWYWLLDKLCAWLQSRANLEKRPVVTATQVKEKYGGLRFYYYGATEFEEGVIDFVEELSYEICEECGSTKNVVQTKGWIKTLCLSCLNTQPFKLEKEEEDEDETIGE